MDIRLKRAYDPASPSDGYRVLVDRLWPRGVSKQRAKLDEWERELPQACKNRTTVNIIARGFINRFML